MSYPWLCLTSLKASTQVSSVNKRSLVGQSKAGPLMSSSEWDGRGPLVSGGM